MAAAERLRRLTRLWQHLWHRHPRASVSRSSAPLPVKTEQDVMSDVGGELAVQDEEARPAYAQQENQRSIQALGARGQERRCSQASKRFFRGRRAAHLPRCAVRRSAAP